MAVAPRCYCTDLIVVAHGIICFAAYGSFPGQGLNSYLLQWQADSLPLSYQEKLQFLIWHSLTYVTKLTFFFFNLLPASFLLGPLGVNLQSDNS